MQDNTYLLQKLYKDIQDIISDVLKIGTDKIRIDSNFDDFGFHSISLTEFCLVLKEKYGFEITPDMIYSYPSIEELASYLMENEFEAIQNQYVASDEAVQKVNSKERRFIQKVDHPMRFQYFNGYEKQPNFFHQQNHNEEASMTEPVAIVGMSGRFPGARNIEELWDIISNGREAITGLPLERREWKAAYGDSVKRNNKMGVVPGIAEFDPAFFEISYQEAENMDPRQRLLLMEMWKALEQAGLGKEEYEKETIGVYVGAEAGLYTPIAGKEFGITSNHDAILAARIAYFLNLQGPNLTLNTACSSGLVALHQACQAIRCGECDVAIVGGVNLLPIPDSYQVLEENDMFSSDGSCHAFDQNANGMVPAEAVAVVVIKNAKKAIQDKNPIWAMVRADGINYDGKTKGITAPSAKSQTKLLRTIYERFHIDVNDISYILAHGTGTKLGDPMELNALKEAFRKDTNQKGFCAITSIKPNVGHCMAASGLVSLIGMVLAMKNKTIPTSINCEEINEYLKEEDSPFYINRNKKNWVVAPGKNYMAGVSSFGISGTNAHVILESYEPEHPINASLTQQYYLFPISAKTEVALKCKVKDFSTYLKETADLDFASVSYTLVKGRLHFKYRVVFVAKDVLQLREQIEEYLSLGHSSLVHSGVVNRNVLVTQQQIEEGTQCLLQLKKDVKTLEYEKEALFQIGKLYCEGYENPCFELTYPEEAKLLRLPTYPFELGEYWAEATLQSNTERGKVISKQQIQQIIARIASIPEEQIEATDTLESLGFDSVKYMDLLQSLEKLSGSELNCSCPYLQWSVESILKELQPGTPTIDNENQSKKREKQKLSTSKQPGKRRRSQMKFWSIQECIKYDIKEIISGILKTPIHTLEEDENFESFGFDSYTLIEFAIQLSDFFEREINPDQLYSYSNIEELANYLMKQEATWMNTLYQEESNQEGNNQEESKQECEPCDDRTYVSMEVSSVKKVDSNQKVGSNQLVDSAQKANQILEPIAIVGMSGRFPGAKDVDTFFDLLLNKKDVVTCIPEERKEWQGIYQTEEDRRRRRMGVLPGVGEFEPMFFDISPREAISMDPRQRLLLEEMWKALEDAGYSPESMKKERIGVFVGAEDTDYRSLLSEELGVVSNHNAALAARLAYFLDLKGTNLTVNTACSSGLTALHQAILSIRCGDCDAAVVAGANIIPRPEVYLGMEKAGMLSEDGTCYAFDKKANGMVPAEAIAVVVIKRQDLAMTCKNPIYASIIGSGTNYDGRTNGITAPSGQAQVDLLQEVYNKYQIATEDISYIVTHGTGTRLGDSIEINALAEVFQKSQSMKGACALTSVKPNIGHSLAASGIVSLIALVKALQKECIPASIHCDEVNDYIRWSESPFYVNQETKEWKDGDGKKRIGAVSAFGIAGTNAHVVVQSYQEEEKERILQPFYLLPFSARTQESLQSMLATYRSYFINERESDLAAVSYTLMMGRKQFDHRCILIVHNVDEAIFLLEKAQAGESLPGIYRNQLDAKMKHNEVIAASIRRMIEQLKEGKKSEQESLDTMYALGEYYALGYEEACRTLFSKPYRLLHLPTYPFHNASYWPKYGEKLQKKQLEDGKLPRESSKAENSNIVSDKIESNKLESNKIESRITESNKTESAKVDCGTREIEEKGKVEQTSQAYVTLIDKAKVPYLEYESNAMKKPEIRLSNLTEFDTLHTQTPKTQTPSEHNTEPKLDGIQMLSALFESIYNGDLSLEEENEETVSKEQNSKEKNSKEKDSKEQKELVRINEEPELVEVSITAKNIGLELEQIIDNVKEILVEELYIEPDDIGMDTSFYELGVDSVIGVDLVKRINQLYHVKLGAVKIYQYPNLIEFARYLYDTLSCETIKSSSLVMEKKAEINAEPRVMEEKEDKNTPKPKETTNQSFETIVDELTRSLAEELFLDVSEIHCETSFLELGLDSIISVNWVRELSKKYKRNINTTKIYQYPNIYELARYILEDTQTVK